jgi:hypothetical protein
MQWGTGLRLRRSCEGSDLGFSSERGAYEDAEKAERKGKGEKERGKK